MEFFLDLEPPTVTAQEHKVTLSKIGRGPRGHTPAGLFSCPGLE